jgi:hypothetical protein
MEFKLTINMDNAFGEDDEDRAREIHRILQRFNAGLWDSILGGILLDSNGNHVGHAWVEETETSSVYAKHK